MTLKIKQRTEPVAQGHWKWAVWLKGPSDELDQVEYVRYRLDPTFNPPTRIIADRGSKFRLTASARAAFIIRADVTRFDGSVQHVEHTLMLGKPRGERRPAGQDQTAEDTTPHESSNPSPAEPSRNWYAEVRPAGVPGALEAVTGAGVHVTFIHGIANKPAADQLLQDWLAALSASGGIDLLREGVSVSMVYWADVLYAEPAAMELVAASGEEAPVEAPSRWEADLPARERAVVDSLRAKFQQAESAALAELAGSEPGAGIEERVPLPWFLKRPLMERLLRDVHHYLFNERFSPRPGETYRVRDEIRHRFVSSLKRATAPRQIVVSHSMGTVISYDCLKRVSSCPRIDTLITLGSPLGLDEVQDMLRPGWDRRSGFPSERVAHWVNVYDHLDPVCGFDPRIANDYKRSGRRVIVDREVSNSGWWRHDIGDYLGQRALRKALRAALTGWSAEEVRARRGGNRFVAARNELADVEQVPRPGKGLGSMTPSEKQSRLREYVHRVAPPERLEGLKREAPEIAASARAMTESFVEPRPREPTPEDAERAVKMVEQGQPLGDAEMFAMEAIVLPRERPVVFVQGDTFARPERPWGHLVEPALKRNLDRAILSIGRVELPDNVTIPFGGTAFVVGPNLLMTNRHVAELFAEGLGQNVVFRAGQTAGWDYRREHGAATDDGTTLEVERILMIHPYWDMALLQVAGLTAAQTPLRLSVQPPAQLLKREVAVIGYPAKDWRNDSDLQDRIFKRVYNVKRLQPGKIVGSETIRSFENNVSAMTHDSSTLGGNSGSAIVDVRTGEVLGLHFAGIYLKANYAVPTYELARDGRVVGTGVNFVGSVSPNPSLDSIWNRLGPGRTLQPAVSRLRDEGRVSSSTSGAIRIELAGASVSIPFEVSLQGVREVPQDGQPAGLLGERAALIDVLEAVRPPVIFSRLDKRKGYDPRFLPLEDGQQVPLPQLTDAGEKIVARLEDGSPELKYHHFSVVMHKRRRLALFTAANHDGREKMRTINGKRPTRDELNGFSRNDRELWVTDDRIPEAHQLPDLFFTKDGGAFDRGHLVRRDDVAWGKSFKDMQKGNGDTFHTTNCSPQVAGFNRSNLGSDNWGDLENMIQQQTGSERVIVFAGPVLDEDDLRFEGRGKRGEMLIQIPSRYWKIIIAAGDHGPEAFGFVLEQDLSGVELELAVPARWRKYMRSIHDIEQFLFGNASLEWLKQHDQYESPRGRRLAGRITR